MNLCYIDESGTSSIPGNTSHYILAGLSIPVEFWKKCDNDINKLKKKWNISGKEIHTAWILRPYVEQKKIHDFNEMDYTQRIYEVNKFRKNELYRLQKMKSRQYFQTKKNFSKTDAYIHLTYEERKILIKQFSKLIAGWGFARLFAECIDKAWFDPARTRQSIDEQAFEQIVSRYEHYLQIISSPDSRKVMGMIIHDNNQTIAKRLTDLMIQFHINGTLWTKIKNIIETPLFVDSQLTSMVQAADLCSYALRRYFENQEDELINSIFVRADRKDGKVVGVRHFSDPKCQCMICSAR
ncbi:DUF3800 domain-containing protein [Acinetobacter sp.]|uniref:DUF3800 domain-containing protein n=1 Tax=Acinetobacter sp. TaxID=472 RepID=UPI003CFF0106